MNINRLAPKTASLFGEMPNSASLNPIAESAMAFAMIVNKDKLNNKIKCIFEFALFTVVVNENKMMAITAISKALNNNKKLRSL